MIVYVSELRPDLLDEVCGRLYLIVTKISQSNLKKLVIGSAADFSHATRFVVDLSALKDATGEVIEAIAAFRAMYAETRVIVIADREPEGSVLFGRLFEIGVYDVVRDLGGEALKKCLTTGISKEEGTAESRQSLHRLKAVRQYSRGVETRGKRGRYRPLGNRQDGASHAGEVQREVSPAVGGGGTV